MIIDEIFFCSTGNADLSGNLRIYQLYLVLQLSTSILTKFGVSKACNKRKCLLNIMIDKNRMKINCRMIS